MYNFKQTFVVRNKDPAVQSNYDQAGRRSSRSEWDLPAVPTREPSNSQLVPFMDHRASGRRSTTSEPEERFRGLETRLKVAEKSNKALLDEVVRLQTELKSVSRRGEDALREERKARQFLENSLRGSNDLVNQLAQRIRSQEEKLQEERNILDSLANQTRSVEKEVSAKKEAQQARISALERDLENMTRAKSQLERVSFKLVDEMRTLKAKLEEAENVQEKSQRMEAVQQKLDQAGEVYQQSQQLRSQLEGALDELRHLVGDLRSRLKKESEERQHLEQKLGARLTEINRSIGEQKRGESLEQAEQRNRERDRTLEADWLTLQAKIHEAMEQVNQKILEKEVKLREDAARNQADSERMILREQEARLTQEREARHQQEERWEAMRKMQEDQLEALRRTYRSEVVEGAEAAKKFQNALEQVERRLHDSLKDVNTLIQEELVNRKAQDVEFTGRFKTLEEKVAQSAASLEQEVAALKARMGSLTTGDKNQLEAILEDYRRETSRKIGGVEEQLRQFRQQLERLDEKIDEKSATTRRWQEGNDAAVKKLEEKLESLTDWQGSAKTQLQNLATKQTEVGEGVNRNSQLIASLAEDFRVRVGSEIIGRVQDVDSIRWEIEQLRSSLPTGGGGEVDAEFKKELEECQTLVRRLAEVVQTVKTVLGMKIQSEQKLRMEELKSVRGTLDEQRKQVQALTAKVDGKKGGGKK